MVTELPARNGASRRRHSPRSLVAVPGPSRAGMTLTGSAPEVSFSGNPCLPLSGEPLCGPRRRKNMSGVKATPGLGVTVAATMVVIAGCSSAGLGMRPMGSTSTTAGRAVVASSQFVTCRPAAVRVAQGERTSSGEAWLYLELRPRRGSTCSVRGFPRAAAVGSGRVLVRYGGDPAMHSPPSAPYQLSRDAAGFFGVGWHTTVPPNSNDRCASLRQLIVWTAPGVRQVVRVRRSRVCGAVASSPYVAVSTVQTRGHFPDANP